MKICNKCKISKKITDFHKNQNWCKECKAIYNKSDNYKNYKNEYNSSKKDEMALYNKQYYEENKNNILTHNKEYRLNNKEKIALNNKIYYENNKEKISKYNENYYEINKDHILSTNLMYITKRYANDLLFKLKKIISAAVRYRLFINNSSKNKKSVVKFLPYTIEQLKQNLEFKFEPWMNWNNHGKYNKKTWNDNDQSTWTWQLDHIIPHSTFEYKSMEDDEFKKCWALENLRPYSAKQNILDGLKTRHNKERK